MGGTSISVFTRNVEILSTFQLFSPNLISLETEQLTQAITTKAYNRIKYRPLKQAKIKLGKYPSPKSLGLPRNPKLVSRSVIIVNPHQHPNAPALIPTLGSSRARASWYPIPSTRQIQPLTARILDTRRKTSFAPTVYRREVSVRRL